MSTMMRISAPIVGASVNSSLNAGEVSHHGCDGEAHLYFISYLHLYRLPSLECK